MLVFYINSQMCLLFPSENENVGTPDARQTAIQMIHGVEKFQHTEGGKCSIALIPRKLLQFPHLTLKKKGSCTVNLSIQAGKRVH